MSADRGRLRLGVRAAVLGALVVLLGAPAVLLGPARPASAHAVVLATVPQQKAVLGFSPTEVTVTFSESVALVPGRTQVLAPDGKRINAGAPTVRGARLHIPIRVADRPLGTYLVSYRVISADSHPIAGGYTFSVGAASVTAPKPPDDSVHSSVRVAVPVTRYLGYAGLVLLIGPTLFLALLWPRRLSRRGPIRLVRCGLGLVAAGTLAALWVQAPYASGAGLLDVSAAELRQVLGTEFGLVLCARLVILVLVAALLPPLLSGRTTRTRTGRAGTGREGTGREETAREGTGREETARGETGRARTGEGRSALPAGWTGRGRVVLLLLLGLAGLATWPLTGHAAAAPAPVANGAANIIHLAAMSAWLGGLVILVGFALRSAHPRALAIILPVWSRWATLAVLWLVVAGVALAVIEIGAPGALFGTGYGRLVLAKLALLAVVLAAAGYARRLIGRRAGNTGRVRRAVALEVAVGVVILGLSSVLVQTTPGRNAGIEAAAATSDTFAQTLTSPLYTLQFDIYPVQLGENNTVHAYVYTPDGRRLPVLEWTLTVALPAKGVEPVATPMLGTEPHHAVGAVNFPIAGDWQLRFTVRISDIDQATVSTTVSVR